MLCFVFGSFTLVSAFQQLSGHARGITQERRTILVWRETCQLVLSHTVTFCHSHMLHSASHSLYTTHSQHPIPSLHPVRAAPALRSVPQRPTALAQHALSFRDAFLQVRRSGTADLGLDQFSAQGCMDLEVDFQQPLDLLLDNNAQPQQRLHLLQQLLTALQIDHKDLIRGWAAAPHQREWAKVKTLRFLTRDTDAAKAALIAAVQNQALEVKLQDSVVQLPVRGVAGRLPVDTVQLEIRGLPPDCARCGITAAVLQAAGYGPPQGVTVLHERLGMVRGPTGERQPFGRMDMVVAVVRTPPQDSGLCCLPSEVRLECSTLTIEVQSCFAPPAVRLCSSPSPPPAAPPRHAQVMDQLGSAHGLTPQVRQAGPSPIAAEAVSQVRPPGSRAGLGYLGNSGAHPSPLQLAPQHPLTPAALPDEPLFGAAVEYMQDYSELCQEEIHKVVLAVKAAHLSVYDNNLGASRAGDLPGALKLLLHTQARSLFGERGGVPDAVAAAWEGDLGEEQVGREEQEEAQGVDFMAEDAGPVEAGDTVMQEGGDGGTADSPAGQPGDAVVTATQEQQHSHTSPYPHRDRRPARDLQGNPTYLRLPPSATPSTASNPAGRGRGRQL